MNWSEDKNNEEEREVALDLAGMDGDRFELLSAYLDGEVSPAERQQVKAWLDSDPQTQQLYQRLLKLRQGWQQAPAPTSIISVDDLAQKIFDRVEQPKKKRKVLYWAGGAIAALFAGALFSPIPIGYSPVPRLASQVEFDNPSEDLLAAVAVDEPAVIIPKAASVHLPKEVRSKLDDTTDY
jgi:anti-sigma factor RsiW